MTKWILRLLLLVLFLGGVMLGLLNLMSGNSPTHKKALGQSFSNILGATVVMDELKEFNIIPQFSIDASGIHADKFKSGEGMLKADRVAIAFGFQDLALGRRRIENFEIENLDADKGTLSPQKIIVKRAEIIAGDKAGEAFFNLEGQIGEHPIMGSIQMTSFEGFRPSYSFAEKNLFDVTFGSVHMTGLYNPFRENGAVIENLEIEAPEQSCKAAEFSTISVNDFMNNILWKLGEKDQTRDISVLCGQIMTLPVVQ